MAAAGTDELAVTYAALILHDAGVPVTAAAIGAVVKAANVSVQPFWPALFERVLKTKNLDDLILNAGAASAPASSGAAAPAAAPAGGAKADDKKAAAPAKKEEPKKEEKPESDDMGFDLFG